jgi:hypothetical protein
MDVEIRAIAVILMQRARQHALLLEAETLDVNVLERVVDL